LCYNTAKQTEESKMPNILIGKMTVEIPDAGTAKVVTEALDEKQAKIDELTAELSTAKGTADALKAKLDQAEQAGQGNGGKGGPCDGLEGDKLDECKKKNQAKMDEAIKAEVAARIDTMEKVKQIAPEAKVDAAMTPTEMKSVALAALKSTAIKVDEADEAYISAAFDIMVQQKIDEKAGSYNAGTAAPKTDDTDPRAAFMNKVRG
jgi:predicted RNase H-like nuclease (RuvC/YqgF family)